jgi:chromate transporter
MNILMSPLDWLHLLGHFLSLSLLAIGGAITTAPDMHRYLVVEQHWISDAQFTASIALAQAAPGPNLLFIPLLGWDVGINSAGGLAAGASAWGWGLLGVFLSLFGILLPSTTLTLAAARWGHRNRELLGVRAFKAGMAPIVIALLAATGWILSAGQGSAADSWRLWLVTAAVTLLVWRTRIHLLWLLAGGALLGCLGVI